MAQDLSNHSKRMIDEEYFVLRAKRDSSRDKAADTEKQAGGVVAVKKRSTESNSSSKPGVRTRSVSFAARRSLVLSGCRGLAP